MEKEKITREDMARPKAADFVVSKNFQCKNFQSKTISCSFEPKEHLRLRKKLRRKRVFGQFEIFHLTSELVFDIFCIWIQILHQSVSMWIHIFSCVGWSSLTYWCGWHRLVLTCLRYNFAAGWGRALGWTLAGYPTVSSSRATPGWTLASYPT